MRFLLFLIFPGFLFSQNVFISKYIPGNYLRNNEHRVELFNAGSMPLKLGGYLIVTRQYSVRLPQNTAIKPGAVFTIGKKSGPNDKLDLELSRTGDFLIRYAEPTYKGNYIALLDRNKNMVDGMFFTYTGEVPFLPDRGFTITYSGDTIYFVIPAENGPFFTNRGVFLGEDPTLCCFIQVDGNWIPTSSNTNLSPVTEYRSLTARYYEGIITLRFETAFEENCRFHEVQRSLNGKDFEAIGQVAGKGKVFKGESYELYDAAVHEGVKYFYRVVNTDIYGNQISSPVQEIIARNEPKDFMMDIFIAHSGNRNEVNIRFLSRQTQRVRIKMLDKGYREVAILFDDEIGEEIQNLLKISEPLMPDDYLIVAETEQERVFKEISIR